jgi:hypothetical protein
VEREISYAVDFGRSEGEKKIENFLRGVEHT